jgi:hypothetical protein
MLGFVWRWCILFTLKASREMRRACLRRSRLRGLWRALLGISGDLDMGSWLCCLRRYHSSRSMSIMWEVTNWWDWWWRGCRFCRWRSWRGSIFIGCWISFRRWSFLRWSLRGMWMSMWWSWRIRRLGSVSTVRFSYWKCSFLCWKFSIFRLGWLRRFIRGRLRDLMWDNRKCCAICIIFIKCWKSRWIENICIFVRRFRWTS